MNGWLTWYVLAWLWVAVVLTSQCRPVGPIRPNAQSAHQAVPLNGDVVRHRLASHSYLRKYLERWDEMTYMWSELQASRRVAQPSHADIIASVGKTFLGIDAEAEGAAGAAGAGGAAGAAGVKRKAEVNEAGEVIKKRGRPPKNPEERKKPGPKKGWKKNLEPGAAGAAVPKKSGGAAKRKYIKKEKLGSAAPSPAAG